MEAGREMDALVAEKVMGWHWFEMDTQNGLWGPDHPWANMRSLRPDDKNGAFVLPAPLHLPVHYDDTHIPHYSTDIAAAWHLVEHMNNTGIGRLELVRLGWGDSPRQVWRATFFRDAVSRGGEARADTAPLAICLAALKAKGANTNV